jgi:hypothetical protein
MGVFLKGVDERVKSERDGGRKGEKDDDIDKHTTRGSSQPLMRTVMGGRAETNCTCVCRILWRWKLEVGVGSWSFNLVRVARGARV